MSRGNKSGSQTFHHHKFCRPLTLSTVHQTQTVLQGFLTRHSWALGLGLDSSSWLRDGHLEKAARLTTVMLSETLRKDGQDGLQRAG